ncbi:MAG TPA: DNA mismatch repair protein MutS [Mycobacterium sp.]|nr:DNA mismatch repair protein MutS [Mycobacterium sp.]HUH71472.1 DNA mismatch repair protein MutS [Mycobacterium sp.]
MTRFESIFFTYLRPRGIDEREAPECFGDLRLDQVVSAIVGNDDDNRLKPFFYTPARHAAEVGYRHAVFRDLQRDIIRHPIDAFVNDMRIVRNRLRQASKIWHPLQKQGWFVHAVHTYCRAVSSLRTELSVGEIPSTGLTDFANYLQRYADDDRFRLLVSETEAIQAELSEIRYNVHIQGLRVHVERFEGQTDYSADVAATFERFRRQAGKDYRAALKDYADMNHVEEQILECVAKLFPGQFQRLQDYCAHHQNFLDTTLSTFAREVQFYLSYLNFVDRFGANDYQFSYPEVTTSFDGVNAQHAFDLALAIKQRDDQIPLVRNSFHLYGDERILVVSGPNQGGKTTFARTVGQLFYLAALGCPVPAAGAKLVMPDEIFTHFERQESISTLRGKLDDELVRIHDILSRASPNSLVVMNESFSSTTASDALVIGGEVLKRIIAIGCIGVYVTFLDQLASLGTACVSMVGDVAPDDPTVRTFRFTRRPADGMAYAAALADKYGLSHHALLRRIVQ